MNRQEIENYIAKNGEGKLVVETLKEMAAEGIPIASITEAQLTDRLNMTMLAGFNAKHSSDNLRNETSPTAVEYTVEIPSIRKTENKTKKANKKKKSSFWPFVIIIICIMLFSEIDSTDDSSESDDSSAKSETVQEEDTEDVLSPEQEAAVTARLYFADKEWWRDIFKYDYKFHYLTDFECRATEGDECENGAYVAIVGADVQNGFGAYENIKIYFYTDEDGNAKKVVIPDEDFDTTHTINIVSGDE